MTIWDMYLTACSPGHIKLMLTNLCLLYLLVQYGQEVLASDEQKLTSFEWLLDLRKDLATGNDLSLLQHAEKAVYHYQLTSAQELVSTLYDIGVKSSF